MMELVTMEKVAIKLMIELNGDIDLAFRGMGRLYRYSILYLARARKMMSDNREKMKMIGAENPSIDRYPNSDRINPPKLLYFLDSQIKTMIDIVYIECV